MDPLQSRSEFKPRCFFKIILSDITPQSRLMIPRMFMSACGDNLADHVFLHTPARSVWKVGLKRIGHEAWLQNGWPKFAEINSLAFGHVLVFQYKGNSSFRVTIMDKSATEIDYPKKQTVMLHIDEEEPQNVKQHTEARPGGKARALAAANGFRSNKPYFLKIVKPSYIGINSVMRIKLECMRGFVGAEGDMVILQVRGRPWQVKCTVNRNRCRLGAGWKEFVEGNALAVGDVFVFELVDRLKKLINVVIYRA